MNIKGLMFTIIIIIIIIITAVIKSLNENKGWKKILSLFIGIPNGLEDPFLCNMAR
ncbi:MAG: hypothetical protein LN589_03030 [Rickettsia endosymbiont of Eriopis connexa]|nr:hypothetical protein [Rickettsia endosymbiont of Eriopis connexa]